MNNQSPRARRLIWVGAIGSMTLAISLLSYLGGLGTAGASPLGQSTCPPPPSGFSQPAVVGVQPGRYYEMRPTFTNAAKNTLGSDGPVYDQIKRGIPPVNETVSSSRPIPHIILRGIGAQESNVWTQFAYYSSYGNYCTLVSADGGYGAMQITSCMKDDATCTDVYRARVAGEWKYNIGTGAKQLIQKWNIVPYIGDNDGTVAEQWYFSIIAYNGWSAVNDPNSSAFYRDRPPYGELNYPSFAYPYQERVSGWMTHPELYPDPDSAHWLWQPTRIASVPRGIFGLRAANDWQPPTQTQKPVFSLLTSIHVANSAGPTIVLRNTTNMTLAADIALYNNTQVFNRWYLGAPLNLAHSYPYGYIRLIPNETKSLPVSTVFTNLETFDGYARIHASDGIIASLQQSPFKVFMPLIANNSTNPILILNGGFETFVDGKPQNWAVLAWDSSLSGDEGYPMADGTQFRTGHYAAYLGGRDYSSDSLSQSVQIPADGQSYCLSYAWYVDSKEVSTSMVYDIFNLFLRDVSGNAYAVDSLSNLSLQRSWQVRSVDVSRYSGQTWTLSLEASTDSSYPTSFFIDDVRLAPCGQ